MWKNFISQLKTASAKKLIATFAVVAIIVLAVVAVPLLSNQESIPVDTPPVEQPIEDPQEETEEPSEEETPEEPKEDDENEETKPDDKETIWDKIIDAVTGINPSLFCYLKIL